MHIFQIIRPQFFRASHEPFSAADAGAGDVEERGRGVPPAKPIALNGSAYGQLANTVGRALCQQRRIARRTDDSRFNPRKLSYLILLTLLFITFPRTCVRAQQTVDVRTFFSRAGSTPVTEPLTRQTYRAPWIENSKLRTETRDFDLNAQRYTLRLNPSSPGKVRAQTALANLREDRPDFTAAEARCDDLRQRYEDWLDLYVITREASLLTRLDTILTDRRTVLERMSATLDFDWSELIALIRQRTDYQLRRTRLDNKKEAILTAYGLAGARLDFTTFLRPEDLAARLATPAAIAPDPELAYDAELVAREIDLERAESRQFFDFLQAEYTGPHADPFRERFSVGLGFQFPNDGNQTLKIRQLELKAREIRNEQRLRASAKTARNAARRLAVTNELELYRQTRELLTAEDAELSRIARRIAGREGVNPLSLLSIEERKVKNALRELDGQREVLDTYLELSRERLCQLPAGELWQH